MPKKESRKKGFSDKLKFDYKRNKEIYLVIGTMVLLVILFIVFYSVFKSFSSFEYNGLKFTKEKIGSVLFYHYKYYFEDAESILHGYNLYIRNDPRRNNVPIEGEITFPKLGSNIYVSINTTGLTKCNNSIIAVAVLADFLAGNMFKVVTSVPDKAEANSSNLTYADCETYPLETTISLREGNETKVTKSGRCYIISATDCEVLEAVEKFEVQAILDAKKRALV